MVFFDIEELPILKKMTSKKLGASFIVKERGYRQQTTAIIRKYDLEAPSIEWRKFNYLGIPSIEVRVFFMNILDN